MAKKQPTNAAPSAAPHAAAATSAPPAPASFDEVMADLARHGTAAEAANYKKLGAADPVFGVSFAHLSDLAKALKPNNSLASQLWTSGNFDAMSLAAMIVDPASMSAADLDRWADQVKSTLICSMFADVAARAEGGPARIKAWTGHGEPARRACGYAAASAALRHAAAGNGPGLTDEIGKSLLERIEKEYEGASEQLRHAMCLALMAIGGYRKGLRARAVATAEKLAPLGCNVKGGIETLAARADPAGKSKRKKAGAR